MAAPPRPIFFFAYLGGGAAAAGVVGDGATGSASPTAGRASMVMPGLFKLFVLNCAIRRHRILWKIWLSAHKIIDRRKARWPRNIGIRY